MTNVNGVWRVDGREDWARCASRGGLAGTLGSSDVFDSSAELRANSSWVELLLGGRVNVLIAGGVRSFMARAAIGT